jgi:hypothetical protein
VTKEHKVSRELPVVEVEVVLKVLKVDKEL